MEVNGDGGRGLFLLEMVVGRVLLLLEMAVVVGSKSRWEKMVLVVVWCSGSGGRWYRLVFLLFLLWCWEWG